MKKITTIILVIVLIFTIVGCGRKKIEKVGELAPDPKDLFGVEDINVVEDSKESYFIMIPDMDKEDYDKYIEESRKTFSETTNTLDSLHEASTEDDKYEISISYIETNKHLVVTVDLTDEYKNSEEYQKEQE